MINIKKNFKKIALTLIALNILSYSFSYSRNFNVQARTKHVKYENTEHEVIVEHLTIKRWFIDEFKKNPNLKSLANSYNNMTYKEKQNKNNKTMKKIRAAFHKLINKFQELDEKEILKIFKSGKKFTKESYLMPDYLKALFKEFWDGNYFEEMEDKLVWSKIPKKNKKDSPVIYVCPGFGYEEEGALHKECNSKKLNAIMTHKVIKELLDNNFEVYTPFDLSYAGLKLPENKNLHVIFDERPPIVGKSRMGKIFEATTKIMRKVFEKTFKENKKSKFCSICIHNDSSSDREVVGSKAYYEVDENTSNLVQKNSKKLAKFIIKHEGGVFDVPKSKGIKLQKNIFMEDWAITSFGLKGIEKEFLKADAAAIDYFIGNMNNKAQIKKLLSKNLQNKTAKNIVLAIKEYLKN